MTAARSSSRVAKVDAGNGVAKKDVAGRVVEPLAPVSASSSGIAMLAQAKLSVGRVDDPAELEADQMAQKFSQWNGAGGSVEVSEGSSGGDAMRSADTGTLETGGFEVGADVQSEISSRSGRGVPLADDQRSKFEQFFGKDLSAVRVHADSDASQLSGSLGAEAFTVGNDVYFGSGRYQSGASDKLLAHELTHVVQQNSIINRWPWSKKKTPPRDPEHLFGFDEEIYDPIFTEEDASERFGQLKMGLTAEEYDREAKILQGKKNPFGYTKTLDEMKAYVGKNKTSKSAPAKAEKMMGTALPHDAFKKWTLGDNLTVKDKMMMCYISFEQGYGHEDDPPFRIGHFMSSNYNYENTKKHTTEMWDKTLDTDRLNEVKDDVLTDKEKEQAIETAKIMQNIMDLIDHFQGLNEIVKSKHDEARKNGSSDKSDPEELKENIDARTLFSHGGRVNIKVPKGSKMEATDEIGITERGARADIKGKGKQLVHKRTAATHGTRFTGGVSHETDGKFSGGGIGNWFTLGNQTWGMDLAIGGAGNLDYNGRVIKCDGSHGHLMINWTAPAWGSHGVLMVGVETTGMGAKSQDGYKHTRNSTEATANIMATAGGLKKEKAQAGASQRLGMHEVDLTTKNKSILLLMNEAKSAKSKAKAASKAKALTPPDDEQFGF
jgi:hypothetical protein